MALNVKHGQLVTTATATQVITGLGFTPKVLLFYSVDTGDDAISPHARLLIGACIPDAGGSHFSMGFAGQDGNYSYYTATGFEGTDELAFIRDLGDYAGAPYGHVTSFDADGFTIAWGQQVAGVVINFLALGGDSILQAKMQSCSWPSASGSPQERTYTLGFRPKLLMFFDYMNDAMPLDIRCGWGAATGPGNQFSMCWSGRVLDTGDTGAFAMFRSDAAMCMLDHGGNSGTPVAVAQLTAIGATGFTMSMTTSMSGTPGFLALALELADDVYVEAGAFTKATGPAPVSQTITAAVQPLALILGSAGCTVEGAPVNDANAAFGAYAIASATQGCAWSNFQRVLNLQVLGTRTRARRKLHQTGTLMFGQITGASTTVAVDAMPVLGTSGFQLDYSHNDANAFKVGYIAIGIAPDAVIPPPPEDTDTTPAFAVFPVDPDWSEQITERAEYKSALLESKNGAEQRIALRTMPRPILRFKAATLEARDTAELEALLWQWSGWRWAVPYWPDGVPLSTDVAAGATVIPVATVQRAFTVGGSVLLWRDMRTFEVGVIASFDASSITLTDGTVSAWAADGLTLVLPLFFGRQTDAQEIIGHTSSVRDGMFEFECDGANFPVAAWPVQYAGFDVLHLEPNRNADPSSRYTRNVFVLDSDAGKISMFDFGGMPKVMRRGISLLLDGRDDIALFRSFRANRLGQVKPFWFPSWSDDLTLAADITAGATTITVDDIFYTERMFPNVARRRLAFITASGTQYFRKVLSVSRAGGHEILTLDSALPAAMDRGQVMVSFLTLNRLAVDDATMQWHTTTIAEATLDTIEIPREVPA
jgi:hypothetical protein